MMKLINGFQRPVHVPTETVKQIVDSGHDVVGPNAIQPKEIDLERKLQESPFVNLKVVTPQNHLSRTPGPALLKMQGEINTLVHELKSLGLAKEVNDLGANWKTFKQAVKHSDNSTFEDITNASQALEAVFTTAEGIISELKRREIPINSTISSNLPGVQMDVANYIRNRKA